VGVLAAQGGIVGQWHQADRHNNPVGASRNLAGPAAQWLWQLLRARGLGVKFRRQVPFGPYIVDFCSHEARLVLSLRGPVRDTWQRTGDLAQRAYVQALGYRLITLTDNDVLDHGDLVLAQIRAVLPATGHLSPGPGFPPPLAADHHQH